MHDFLFPLSKMRRAALPVLSVLLLAACGSGGSDDDGETCCSSPPPPAHGATLTLQGFVGKGIVTNGVVTAEEVSAGGLVTRGTSGTDATGAYNLTVTGYLDGPLIVTVKGGGADSQMICDVRSGCGSGVAFGAHVPIDSSFAMRTILPSAGAVTRFERCITAYSDLAVSRAIELAGSPQAITSSIASSALSEVSNLIGGIDVQRVCVVDLTDPAIVHDASPEEITYSVLGAGTLALVPSHSGTQALSTLSSSFAGGVIRAKGSDAGGSLSLQQLIDAARAELDAGDLSDPTGTLALMQQNADSAPNGVYDPQPSSASSEQKSAVATAQAFVGNVRDFVLNTQDEYEDPANAFRDQLQLANDASSDDIKSVFKTLGKAVDETASFYDKQNRSAGTGTINTTDDNGTARAATITVKDGANGGNDTITIVGDVRNETVNLSLSWPSSYQGSLTALANGSVKSRASKGVELAIASSGLQAQVVSAVYNDTTKDFDADQASFVGEAQLQQFGVSDPVTITGHVEARAVQCTGCSSDADEINQSDTGHEYNPQHILIKGKIANAANQLNGSVDFSVPDNVARNFDDDKPVGAGNVLNGVLSISFDTTLAGKTASVALVVQVSGVTDADGFDGDQSKTIIDGQVTLKVQTATTGILTVVGVPVYTNGKISSAQLKITDTDSDSLNVTIPIDDDSDTPVEGHVLVGTVEAGVISETDDGLVIIRYSDGSFESLV
jgi:hypothetical protein